MGRRFGRDIDEIRLEIAYAFGTGRDVVEHFRQLARARYGRGGEDGDRDAE